MGFLDKAKKLADQAQVKLDEVQKDFNAKQGSGAQPGGSGSSSVEFDQHGRPVAKPDPGGPDASPAPAQDRPQGDPLADQGATPPTPPTPSAPAKPPTPPSSGSGLSSGDPLGG